MEGVMWSRDLERAYKDAGIKTARVGRKRTIAVRGKFKSHNNINSKGHGTLLDRNKPVSRHMENHGTPLFMN